MFICYHHKTTSKHKTWLNTHSTYTEIKANPSYALRNMGNYSQRWNMTAINGTWYTTKSENRSSSPNNNEIPSTSMHTTPEIYQRYRSITNYEGAQWITKWSECWCWWRWTRWWRGSPLHQGGIGDVDGSDFSKVEASEQHDLPTPGVGEDSCLSRGLCKSWENYGVTFFAIRCSPQKYKGEMTHDGQKGPLMARPTYQDAPWVLVWASWPSPLTSGALGLSFGDNSV
jgi:hypothetical protein